MGGAVYKYIDIISLAVVSVFHWWEKKRGRVAGKHNYCEKPPPKAPDLKISANIWQKRVTEASSTGHLTFVMDRHAASSIFLKDFSYPIGEPFILQFRLLFTLFFLHGKQRWQPQGHIWKSQSTQNTCCKVEPEVPNDCQQPQLQLQVKILMFHFSNWPIKCYTPMAESESLKEDYIYLLLTVINFSISRKHKLSVPLFGLCQ